MEKLSRREMLKQMAYGSAGIALMLSGLSSCFSPSGRHPDQGILRNGCDGCGLCHCPYGVDIKANLSLYNKEAEAGRLPDPREVGSSVYQQECRYFVKRLNQIPRLAQADRCISCQKCAGTCPRQVDIPLALRQMESLIQKVKEDGTLE